MNLKRNANKIITLCLSEKILKKISGAELKDVITLNPKTITQDAYAASALNLMEKYLRKY